jgi:hypothetical protein
MFFELFIVGIERDGIANDARLKEERCDGSAKERCGVSLREREDSRAYLLKIQ